MSPQKWLSFELHCCLPQLLMMITTVTNLKSVNDNQTVSQKQMNQCFYRLVLYEQHIAALFYTTILQDSITLFSLFNNTFFKTIETNQFT